MTFCILLRRLSFHLQWVSFPNALSQIPAHCLGCEGQPFQSEKKVMQSTSCITRLLMNGVGRQSVRQFTFPWCELACVASDFKAWTIWPFWPCRICVMRVLSLGKNFCFGTQVSVLTITMLQCFLTEPAPLTTEDIFRFFQDLVSVVKFKASDSTVPQKTTANVIESFLN